MKNILLCRIDGNFGGVERYILTLANSLDKNVYNPIVIALANRGELLRIAQNDGIATEFIPMKHRLDLISAARTLTQIARDKQAHLIHTFGIRSNTLAILMKLVHSIPWVIRLPNINRFDYSNSMIGWLSHWYNNQLILKADGLQVISPQLEAYVQTWEDKPKNIYRIINGVDVKTFQSSDQFNSIRDLYQIHSNGFVIGTMGRLDPIKGYDILIRAFHQIHQILPLTYLMIIGDGPEKKYLIELSQQLDLQKNVIFTGFINDIIPYYQSFDLYVCSSRSEGVPLSILEAMSMEIPIISTRVGGIESIIRHEIEGILIEKENESAIINTVLQLIDNPEYRNKLGNNARLRILNEFTNKHMVKQVQVMYDQLIDKAVNSEK